MSNPLWLDDLHVGDKFRTDVYDLTAAEIIEFSTSVGPAAVPPWRRIRARHLLQGTGRQRLQTAVITMRLLVTTGLPLATGIIGASIDLAWPTPTRPGDQLHVELEVTDVRVSSRTPPAGSLPRPTTPSINTAMSDSAPRLDCWRSQGHTDRPARRRRVRVTIRQDTHPQSPEAREWGCGTFLTMPKTDPRQWFHAGCPVLAVSDEDLPDEQAAPP